MTAEKWPCIGIGGLIQGYKGNTLIITWPMKNSIDAGSSVQGCFNTLARLTDAKAKAFMKNISWFSLEAFELNAGSCDQVVVSAVQSRERRNVCVCVTAFA